MKMTYCDEVTSLVGHLLASGEERESWSGEREKTSGDRMRPRSCRRAVGLFVSLALFVRTQARSEVSEKKVIYLAGIFPINGVEGWQGGQVGQNTLIGRDFEWGQLFLF